MEQINGRFYFTDGGRLFSHLKSTLSLGTGFLFFLTGCLSSPVHAHSEKENNSEQTTCALALSHGALSPEWLNQMHAASSERSPMERRIGDAVRSVGFEEVAYNWDIDALHSDDYTIELPTGTPTNQMQSGRCWIFAGLNVLKSQMIAEGKIPEPRSILEQGFEFSQSYLHFFNMLEKSNYYLETVIRRHGEELEEEKLRQLLSPRSSIGDGGWWNYFQFLVKKYGLVPQKDMPESMGSLSTGVLTEELIDHLTRVVALILKQSNEITLDQQLSQQEVRVKLRATKEIGMRGIWKILTVHLGKPPSDFIYRQNDAPIMGMVKDLGPNGEKPDMKTREGGRVLHTQPARLEKFTPREFSEEIVEFDPNDFVTVTANDLQSKGVFSLKHSSIGKALPAEPAFNRRVLNLNHRELEALVVQAIVGGHAVWFAADMGKAIHHRTGIMHPSIYVREGIYGLTQGENPPPLHQKDSQYLLRHASNHAMAFTGVDIPDEFNTPIKFKVENSWGVRAGDRGTYHMYREWFYRYVSEVIIPKKFLPKKWLTAWENGPVKQLEEDKWYY